TLHVALLCGEIFGQLRASVIEVVDALGAGEPGGGLERKLRGHAVIGMIPRIEPLVLLGDIELDLRRGAALVRDKRADCRPEVGPAGVCGRAVDWRQRLDLTARQPLERLVAG